MAVIPPDPKYLLRSDMGCIHSLLFWINSDVEHLYAGCALGKVYIWDLKRNRILTKFDAGIDPCLTMHNINNNNLLVQQKCGSIKIYNMSNSHWSINKIIDHDYHSFCRCQVLSEDIVITALKDSNIGLYSVKSSNMELTLYSSEVLYSKKLGEVMAIKPLPSTDQKILVAYEIGLLVLWDITAKKVLHCMDIESCPMALDFETSYMQGIIGSPSEKLEIFNLSSDTLTTKCTLTLKNPGTSVISVRPDKKLFTVGNWDGRLRIFSQKTLKQLAVLDQHKNTVHDVIYSPHYVEAYNCKYLMAAAGKDNGNAISKQIKEELRSDIDAWISVGNKKPKLVAILVGENPASQTYVQRKMESANFITRLGIESYTINLKENTTQNILLENINNLNEDPSVDGIIVQLPLPKGLNEKEVCQAISPKKDVDGFHLENIGNLTLDSKGIIPATVLGVKELIVRSNIKTFGKHAVVIGRSKHVGLPIALLLHADGRGATGGLDMTTTICHINTPSDQLKQMTRLADLVVVAAGVPGLVTKDMIKPGACVIDVGINRVKDKASNRNILVGDVDYENVKKVAQYITPVPGGVGPMTVTMLLKNTFAVAMKNSQHKKHLENNISEMR
ncbi:guanine nucleotide-binding protein subunit beta-like protein 1 isoform X3 [Vespula maculifrons]|uniref:methenyltetrahydrofolate cyclohydrolase n=1 Tax=Vespula maculifrons TaxID=7453 RepID=A0ABD2CAS7_VESMC